MRGRKPYSTPRIGRMIYLPADLFTELELLFFDPVRKKTSYGKRNAFIVAAIKHRLSQVRNAEISL